MKNKRISYLILPVFTLILELLPYGAVCNFALAEGEVQRETYSYFSLIPYGYANFAPFLTALITCVIIVLLAVYCFTGKCTSVIKTILWIAVVLSICPIISGLNYFSVTGALITVTLIAEAICFTLTTRNSSR